MLATDANDVLPVQEDLGVRADGTMAQRILRTVLDRLENAAPWPEQTTQSTGIWEKVRALVDDKTFPVKN